MNYAKLATAKTFLVGPILDSAGVAKTDEVVANIKVTKNGTVGAVDAQDTLTHNHTGHYVFVSDGGDFDTLGEVEFSLNSGTNAMAPVKFQVLPATTYDAIVTNAAGAAGGLPVLASVAGNLAVNANIKSVADIAVGLDADPINANVTQISGDSTAADTLETACDNYSATRGLAGTALPDAAAGAAGGVLVVGTGDGGVNPSGGKVPATVAAGDVADIPKLKIASTTGNWATAGTWSDGVVPAAGENIIIRDGITVTVAATLDLGQFGTLESQGNGKLNIGSGVTTYIIPHGWVIAVNYGTVTVSYGTITTNSSGTVTNNYGTIDTNNGPVTTNYGTVTINNDTITANNGTIVTNNSAGTVSVNYRTVIYNNGTVAANNSTGIVVYNAGAVTANNASVIFTADTNDNVSAIKAKTDLMSFLGSRLMATCPPSSGVVGGPSVFAFSMEAAVAAPLVSGGSTTDDAPGVLTGDIWVTTTTHTDATTSTQWQVSLSVVSHDPAYTELIGDPAITLSSSDESIATVDVSGMVHYVADGSCLVIGTSAAIGTSPIQRVEVPITNSSVSPVSAVSYTYADDPGSARENTTAAIDSRIAVAGKQKAIFSLQDHTAPSYVRNVDCWAADLDLTCCSPWNSYTGNTRAGTLISPRHFVCAQHYFIPNGSTIRFVDTSNNIVTRTVVNSVQIGTTDLRIGVLDSDVTGCTFAKVLPDDWATYIPNNGLKIPALVLDQEEKALVDDVLSIGVATAQFQVPTDTTRQEFHEKIIWGDSGNPSFLIVNDELVILTAWHYGGAGSGPSIAAYKTEIEAAMVSLGGGYSALTEIDLSGFNTY